MIHSAINDLDLWKRHYESSIWEFYRANITNCIAQEASSLWLSTRVVVVFLNKSWTNNDISCFCSYQTHSEREWVVYGKFELRIMRFRRKVKNSESPSIGLEQGLGSSFGPGAAVTRGPIFGPRDTAVTRSFVSLPRLAPWRKKMALHIKFIKYASYQLATQVLHKLLLSTNWSFYTPINYL